MGQADTITRRYMSDNAVFADAFNFFVYGGKSIIQPDQLHPLDAIAVETMFNGNEKNISVQKIRDNLKHLTVMTDNTAAYAVLGIENQTDVHYAMPVRTLLYDAMEYSGQVQQIAREHKRNKDYAVTNGEYLSGFYKSDRLMPVITLVIYFGANEWDAPRSLHEMMHIEDTALLQQVENYHIRLIAPYQLNDADFQKFQTTLGPVLQFIKHSKEKETLELLIQDDAFKTLDRTAAMVINSCTNAKIKLQDTDEEEINMCQAIDEMIEEGRAQGHAEGVNEGKQEATRNLAKRLLEEGTLSAKKIAELTQLSLAELQIMREVERKDYL